MEDNARVLLKKIDKVLSILNLESTFGSIRNQTNFSLEESKSIIRKLRKDDYLVVYKLDSKETMDKNEEFGWSHDHRMHRTFEGDLFVANGRYEQQAINAETDLTIKSSRERCLANGTIWLAIGTFLIVAWEMIKTFCIEHHGH